MFPGWGFSMAKLDERAFESHFCHQLEVGKYTKHASNTVDYKHLCLHMGELEAFLECSQSEVLGQLKQSLGQSWRADIAAAYEKALQSKQSFELLRAGLVVDDRHLYLVSWADQDKNRFSYTRQYYFNAQESIDIVLFLNGIAMVTIELKNEPSGQYVNDAVSQYLDRDLDDPVFNLPFLHIAADNTRVKVAAGFRHRNADDFRDFNDGLENPKPEDKREYPTHYLYHDVLLPDSLLNIIKYYLYSDGDHWVFPRFHQRRVVKRVFHHLVEHFGKTGHLDTRYLVQHSAGSGKSNTIVWLVQNLRDLSVNGKKLFHCMIVVTDRINLDDQIAKDFKAAIAQDGVVGYAESTQELKTFLNEGRKVIVTTLHKFSYLQDVMQSADKRICFIIDEGHRSHGNKLNENMTNAVAVQDNAEGVKQKDTDAEQLMAEVSEKSFPNIAFIALTATPSDMALQKFGNHQQAFDTYSMDEAIQEGYILDVVKSLVPYDTISKLSYQYQSNHEYQPLMVYRALKQITYEDDKIILEKVDRIIQMFDEFTADKIKGRAKAMVVASSRLAAVKYKTYFDAALASKPYKALVAFSGSVKYEGDHYTESAMNSDLLPSSKIKTEDAFDQDDALRILIVANKFQTGFDQPLLHSMFLDKPVRGINAVQTLSRLNRRCPHKVDTLTVDFTGSAKEIIKAFKKFQGHVQGNAEADPKALPKLYQEILTHAVFSKEDVAQFKQLKASSNPSDSAPLSGLLCNVKKRYEEKYKSLEDKREFRALIGKYLGLYRYIRALFHLPENELLDCYTFCLVLYPVLADMKSAEELKQELEYVKVLIYKIDKADMPEIRESEPPTPPGPSGPPKLSTVQEVIDALNAKFKDVDKADCEKIAEHLDRVFEDKSLQNVITSNQNTDAEILFAQVMQEKLDGQYQDFIYDHCPPDRFTQLFDDEVKMFVARNAYHLLRQSTMPISAYR